MNLINSGIAPSRDLECLLVVGAEILSLEIPCHSL